MRRLFWILLLANIGIFAVIQVGWIGSGDRDIKAQSGLNQDMVRLVEPSPAASTKTPSAPAQAQAPRGDAAPVQAAKVLAPSSDVKMPQSTSAPMANNSQDKLVCLEWGDLSGAALARATAELSAMHLGDKLAQSQIERDIGYWVYIPPLKSKAAVNKKLAELAAFGIHEYFVIQGDGRWRNSISLGMFSTEEAAQNYLDELRTKGVHSARSGERSSRLKATVFKLNGVDASVEKKLTEMQRDYAGSELKKVPCALTR
jgi:hypothetical protein